MEETKSIETRRKLPKILKGRAVLPKGSTTQSSETVPRRGVSKRRYRGKGFGKAGGK